MAPGEYDPSAIGFPDIVTSQEQQKPHGHKRSNTVSGLGEKLFGKRGSFFGGRTDDEEKPRKQKKSHPPVSMTKPLPNDNSQAEPRRSGESRRTSFSFSRKNTTGQEKDSSNRTSRRFSFIPSFVKTADKEAEPRSKEPRPRMAFGRGESRSPSGSTSTIPVLYDSNLDRPRDVSNRTTQSQPHPHRNPQAHPEQYSSQPTLQYPANPDVDYYSNHAHDRDTPTPPVKFYGQHGQHQYADQQHNIPHNPQYPTGFNTYENMEDYRPPTKHSVLQKRRGFNEAYESESRHDGSSGAARRVMDFFRKRARARTEA
jgi:protein-serine/threonine kinase